MNEFDHSFIYPLSYIGALSVTLAKSPALMITKVFKLRSVIYGSVLPFVLLPINERSQPAPTVSAEHDSGQKVLALCLSCDIENIKSRILWKDDLGNASREDAYNKGQVLTICFPGIITQLAKRIIERKKEENKRDERLPFLPNNDRDVFALGAQLALINRLKIHSIGELDTKAEELSKKITKLTNDFNTLNVRHSEIDKLLQQIGIYDDLSGRDKLSLSEKMRLQMIRQTLSRHGISDKSDIDRLAAEARELNEKISALKTEIEDCHTLQKSFQEIKDTYNDISKGDYISKLIEKNRQKAGETSQEMGTDKQDSETLSHDKRKLKL